MEKEREGIVVLKFDALDLSSYRGKIKKNQITKIKQTWKGSFEVSW